MMFHSIFLHTLLDINPSRLMINTGVVILREFRRWDSSHFFIRRNSLIELNEQRAKHISYDNHVGF